MTVYWCDRCKSDFKCPTDLQRFECSTTDKSFDLCNICSRALQDFVYGYAAEARHDPKLQQS